MNLLLVGCGMMGARHMRGLAELERTLPGSLRLAALCDSRTEVAAKVADEAEELFGYRPAIHASVDAALAAQPDLQAADLVTSPRSHDDLAVTLMEAGLHVMCEKPLALTMARGRRMIEAAQRTGRVLATAENNRHDPMARLAQACLKAGLIGEPNFLLQIILNPSTNIIGTAWRHRLAMGGALLDVGIHAAYGIESLLGPIQSVSAHARQVQQSRSGKEFDGTEVTVAVDSEDTLTATLDFGGNLTGSFAVHFASPGETMGKRLIIGGEGTMDVPGERSGQPPTIRRGGETLTGEALLPLVPEYRLNEIETLLWGERPSGYQVPYPETDRKLIAAETHSFLQAIRTGSMPEADAATGLRSVAIIEAMLESSVAGRTVTIDEVLRGDLHAYQDRLEAAR